ncbi:MAG: MerR family transcriptional regulator [Rhizobiales bacterium]|nr:MerR family transcriptional regulator [Hyphomicrobiales bacterium]
MNDGSLSDLTQTESQRLIGQVAEHTGLEPKTVRYYERAGLLKPKRIGRLRIYAMDDVERLKVIKLLRQFDLPIRTIKSFIQENEAMRVDHLPDAAKEAMAKQLERRKSEFSRLEKLTRSIDETSTT